MKDISIRKMAEDSYPANYKIKIINDIDFAPSYRLDYGSANYETGVFNKNGQLVTKPGLKYATFKSGEAFLQVNYSDMINVGLLSEELYEVTISKLSNTYGWKRIEPSEAPTASDGGTEKGVAQRGLSQNAVNLVKAIQEILVKQNVKTKLGSVAEKVTVSSAWDAATDKAFVAATKLSGELGIQGWDGKLPGALEYIKAFESKLTTGGQVDTTAPASEAPKAPASEAPAAAADTSKAIDGLKKILRMAESNSLKIDTKGFDFKSESKVWRGVIKGYDGADKAAEVCLKDAGFTTNDLDLLSKVALIEDAKVSAAITMQPYLKKINDFFYRIKNMYSKRFLGITVATEEQIARAVSKGLKGGAGKAATSSLAQLNLLSKVAARRERAKKSLDSAIEKEASVEDDMTSKVEKRRAAARAKLGL